MIDLNKPRVTHAEKAPGTGLAFGLQRGIWSAILLFFVGLFSYLALAHAVGIIFWVFAVAAPFISAYMASTITLTGPCPYCGNKITDFPKNDAIKCPSCKNTFTVRGNQFYTVAQ